jgi:hypothetical protein
LPVGLPADLPGRVRSRDAWGETSPARADNPARRPCTTIERRFSVGSVIKKRRKRMAKKKHRKLLKKTRVQRRNKK